METYGCYIIQEKNTLIHMIKYYHIIDKLVLKPWGKSLEQCFWLNAYIDRNKLFLIQRIGIRLTYHTHKHGVPRNGQQMHVLRGLSNESFMLLPKYCHNLELRSPGTITYIDIDVDNQFRFFFITLGCLIRAFQQFCHSIICIETQFIVIRKDSNNQIFQWYLVLIDRRK